MKHIAIIGSTGSTGKELVKLACKSNYLVTVIERTPKSIPLPGKLNVVTGDVTDFDSLVTALANVDVLISCFGPSKHKEVGNLMSLGTTNLVKACEERGVKRLIFMSGFVQAEGDEFFYPAFALLTNLAVKLMRQYFKDSYHDKIIAERAIEHSKIDWVVIRATGLSLSKPTGHYKAGIKAKVSPFKTLSYADCARCLLDAVEEHNWTNQIINLGRS